jgi:3-oxoacyl-[acyl-carrier-protein] synthase-3
MGLGAGIPARLLTNRDLEAFVDTTDQWIVEHTGIHERRICADGQSNADLCVEAAAQALEEAHVRPEDLELVIVATLTNDFRCFPAVASVVQDRLGARNAGAFDLSAGCTGWVYALAVGSAFVSSGMYDRVLVIGCDVLSKITDWTDRATCVLFGDGAGAAVVGPAEPGKGVLGYVLESDGALAPLLHIPVGGTAEPMTPENLARGDHYIKMEGHEVFRVAVRKAPEMAEKTVKSIGLTVEDIDWLVLHQANQRINQAAVKRLGLAPEKVVSNVERYGNTSSGSVPLLLAECHDKFQDGDLVVIVGFGAGFTYGGLALRWG